MSWFLRNLRFHAVEDGVELLRDEYGDNPHLTLLAREIGHLLALDQETTGSPGRVYGVGVPGTVGGREFLLASCYEGNPELEADLVRGDLRGHRRSRNRREPLCVAGRLGREDAHRESRERAVRTTHPASHRSGSL